MRLSRLHIAGFKSFPDRAELGFDHGVTAIVGPNGCGKSNVVDAITWVLGEQSAKSLRGERMEDVIFNGSDARKPTPAAEVRLKLSAVAQMATAAAEAAAEAAVLEDLPALSRDVEIGRRLYRSGESEYLIDGEVCRLRDVHDLLMDSGLGIKAYAVIEQGKIGQILASRPAERRLLIEEAAGVTKYKSRRRSAELKLEAAQQNLTRVDDIVFEVEKQRGALKRQAARARRYRRLREALRQWEQVQMARRHDELSRAIAEADGRLEDAKAREAAAAAHLAAREVALEDVRLRVTQAENDANATRERAHARELELGRREQQIVSEKQQVADLGTQVEAFRAELADLEARRGPAREAIERQRVAHGEAQSALTEAGDQLGSCDQAYQEALGAVQAVEQESDATRAAVLAAATTLSALRQAADNAAAALDRIAAERERLELERRELQTEATRAGDQRAQAESALAEGRDALAQAIEARVTAELAAADARTNRDELSRRLSERQRTLAGTEARLRSLEALDARRASFGDAARLLLAEAGSTVRHHGALADHLTVERSYERAVDALLGDLLQHVVVDGSDDLAAGLRLLADRHAGRCGFVVLDAADGAAAGELPLVVPPGARTLQSVVKVAGPARAVVERLLGRALIAESLDAARQMAGTVSVPVAALSGEVCRGPHVVEGGTRQDVHGILETRAEIQSLKDETTALTDAVSADTAELEVVDARLVDANARLATCVAAVHDREKALVSVEGELRRASDDADRTTRRLGIVATERQRCEEEEQSATRRREDALTAIAQHEGQHEAAQTRVSGVLEQLQAVREAAEGRRRLVLDARTTQAGLTERVAALATEVARLEETARELDARAAARTTDVERHEHRRQALQASIEVLTGQLDDDVRAIEAFRRDLQGADEQLVSLRAEFQSGEQDIRGARQDLESVRAIRMESELARASAASDVSHLAATAAESFGLSLDEVAAEVRRLEASGELASSAVRLAAPQAEAEGDEEGEEGAPREVTGDDAGSAEEKGEPVPLAAVPASPEAMIAALREKIDRLGAVNLMAIEQFDELEARHVFLTSQRQDLLDSISQTGEAIRKIDKTTRERFAEAFEAINTHFQQTFTTLFGGGRAGLVLIDQEHDTDSGIDIIAQPPGKRLQNVQLLSGGEKALTAMALMFAIFKHRPSPFCLLDEIDAPLDDANIGRFVEMLQGMQDHTQFILITHNRKTMEIADRLYGVTMEEPGVSKLISLQVN